MIEALLALAFLCNVVAAGVAVRNTQNWINPFSFVLCLFGLAAWFQLVPPIHAYRGFMAGPTAKSAAYIFIFSAGFLITTFFLRPVHLPRPVKMVGNFPKSAVISACFVGNLLITLMILRKNGWTPPLLLIGDNWGTRYHTSYTDHDIPFFSPLSFGLGRFIWIVLFFEYALSKKRFVDHFNENKIFYLMALICCFTGILSARRNVLFWPICWFGVSYALSHRVSTRVFVRSCVALAAFVIVFTALGNLRRGSLFDTGNRIWLKESHYIEIPILIDVYGQIARYVTPVYANLTAIIEFPPRVQYGKIIFSELVPDKILSKVMRIPEMDAIGYLSSSGLLPLKGQTFRSVFTDLYADFGYLGSLVAGIAIFSGMVWLYNNSARNPYAFFLYLVFLPGLVFSAFINGYSQIITLVSIPIFLVSFRVLGMPGRFHPAPAQGATGWRPRPVKKVWSDRGHPL